MGTWKVIMGILAAVCFGVGGWAFSAGDMALAVGLWVSGFVLALVAGAGSYVTDLLGAT